MRRIFLLFFVAIFSVTATGQQLPEGKFVYATGFTAEEITIQSCNKFHYKITSCTYEREGAGEYIIDRDTLKFLFETTADHQRYQPKIVFENQPGDSVSVDFTFFDLEDSSAIPFTTIRFMDKRAGIFYGTVSGMNGKASLKIANYNLPVTLETKSVGRHSNEILIDKSGAYNILFPVHVRKIKPFSNNDNLSFVIENADDEALLLAPDNSKKFVSFTKQNIE